jgi:hypothetical protein
MAPLLWLESCLAVLTVVAALYYPRSASNWLAAAEKRFAELAQRPRLCVVAVGISAIAARIAVLPILPTPVPCVHDEFSYLLAADTFAHSRLTNPPHPMWVHLETFHVIYQPTYASMFHPAQGLILALSQIVTGKPFWGVCLSMGLMCAAICWMLQGWVPARWALLGGLLAVMRFGVFSYWVNSYWGGAAAGIGGALVMGALPRISRSQKATDALLMGLGLALLANSRPYEGLVFCLPAVWILTPFVLREMKRSPGLTLRRTVLPLAGVCAVCIVAMTYYFWRVTGNPFQMPYVLSMRAYNPAPYFIWQSPNPIPTYHHQLIRDYYLEWALPQYTQMRSFLGFARATLGKLEWSWLFFLGPALSVPLILAMAIAPYGLSWQSLSRTTRFLLATCMVAVASLIPAVYFSPHYAAPMTCVIVALVVQAMRYVRGWRWRDKPAGLLVVRWIPLIYVVMLLVRMAATGRHWEFPTEMRPPWCSVGAGNLETRAQVLADLERKTGLQLAIVRYGTQHEMRDEWVYNAADIDRSKVVWARDMGPAQNQELVDYFRNRKAWLIEPDEEPPRIVPYAQAIGVSSELGQEPGKSTGSPLPRER